MQTLQKYVLIEFIVPCLFSLIGLTLVLLLGNLVQLTDLVVTKGVPLHQVLKLFFLLLPYLLSFSLPMAILVGTLLAFGRLTADNEIIAMRASGISLVRLASPILAFGLMLSLVSLYLNDQILPKSHLASRKLLVQIGTKNPTAYLEAGTFIRAFEGYILFIYEIRGNELFNIRIYQPQEGKPTRTLVARKGELLFIPGHNIVKLKLTDGTSDEPNPRDPTNIYKLKFETYSLTLNLSEQSQKDRIQKKPKDMSLAQLRQEIDSLKKEGVNPSPLSAEFHKKIALAFANFFLILVGFPLAIIAHRGERSIGFAIAIAVLTFYYVSMVLGEALVIHQLMPAVIAIWAPNVTVGALGMVLIGRLVKV